MKLFKRALLTLSIVSAFFVLTSAALGQTLTITTFAGHPLGGSEDGTGSAARFSSPAGVAADGYGNVYVADTANNTIRKITPGGAVTTLAGLAGMAGSADGTGSVARFDHPIGIAVDGENLYVADTYNHTIRKITAAGTVSTLAGAAGRVGSDDGIGNAARFDLPWAVASDRAGNLFVADTGNHTIRKIVASTGAVTTLAGLAGLFGSVDGIGSAARFTVPSGLAVDSAGNIYVADAASHIIRRITPARAVTTFAGLADNSGSADGAGSSARFQTPRGVATDAAGNVFIAEEDNHTIRKITPDGIVSTFAGLAEAWGCADGIVSAARFYAPIGVAADSGGIIYVADAVNGAIRKITPGGMVATLAGLGGSIGSNDGPRAEARFSFPGGLATDAGGNIYVADYANATVRKIAPSGAVTTLAGLARDFGSADGVGSAARFYGPLGLAADSSGNVYVADSENSTIRKVTPGGVVTTLAGSAGEYGDADGTGSAARFSSPAGVAVDDSGNVFVADTFNAKIRKITPAGVVTTVSSEFAEPSSIAVGVNGELYVADSGDYTIRKISPSGVVTVVAGLSRSSGSTDGPAGMARFSSPTGLAIDRNGNLYVSDSSVCDFFGGCSGNDTIRKITPAGMVSTIAGFAGMSGSSEGTGRFARFNAPGGLAVDGSGNLYIADLNNAIRIGRTALEDMATIDAPIWAAGTTRLLDTHPQTANSWQWSVIRRPADSIAELSSATVRNPTFTPDLPGLYTFRVVASDGSETSITTVDFIGATVPRRRAVR